MKNECYNIEAIHEDRFYRLVFDSVRDPILIIRPDGQILDANNAIVMAVGYSKEELFRLNIADLRPAYEKPKVGDHLKKSRQGATFETVYQRKDGSIFPVEISTQAALFNGETAYIGIIRDITERKRAEESLKESEARYKAFFENSIDAVIIMSLEGDIESANAEACRIFGKTEEEIIRGGRKGIVDTSDPRLSSVMEERRRRGKYRGELNYRRNNGTVFPGEFSSAIFKDRKGNEKIALIIRDISDRKKYEESLRKSEEKYRRIVETANEGIWMIDQDGRTSFVNGRLLNMLGYTEEEMLGKRIQDFLSDPNPASIEADIYRHLQGAKIQNESMLRKKDGTHIWCLVSATPIIDEHGVVRGGVGMLTDITKRKHAEEERERLLQQIDEQRKKLEESVKIYRAIGEMIPFGIWICGLDGGVLYYSQSYLDMAGMTFEELKEFGWSRQLPPEDVEQTIRDWKHCIGHEDFWKYEHHITGANGQKHVILSRGVPIKDDDGNTTCWAGINLDITDMKEKEAALLDAVTQADLYMDLMGHDINNINQAAIGFLELALMTLETERKLGREDKNLIERPLKALQTSSRLIENVRKIKKLTNEGITITAIDLRKVLKELDTQSFDTSGRDVTINIPDIPHSVVRANELIRDVLINLITNAVKHSGDEKPLLISVNVEPVSLEGKAYYKCNVEDNGPGIPDEVKGKLFHRFQRGSTRAHGKGLGLYLVRTLVEGYRGKVWVEDRVPGDHTKGAKFVVMLSAAEPGMNMQ